MTGCARSDAPLHAESYTLPCRAPGIQLYVRNKRPAGPARFGPEKTLLYLHGATQGGGTTFDMALDGLSWMDYIARHGHDVYFVDYRGYGGSTRLPEMDRPAAEHPPLVRTDAALEDVATAIDHILARRGLTQLNVLGWSWGAEIAGRYTSQHGERVHRLVLYAPPWVRETPIAGPQPPLGAYQTWTMEQARARLQVGAPEHKKKDLMPPAWFRAWSEAVHATDPVGATQSPPIVRSPSGVLQDAREYVLAGKPSWDPSRLTVPTLVVQGEWDGNNPLSRTQALFGTLANAPYRRLVEIGEGTHVMLLERNRMQLFREVQLFLDEPPPVGQTPGRRDHDVVSGPPSGAQ